MYIRRTTIKSRKDGSQYYTYRLVESERTEKGVRQRTIINLGTGFSLPREQWPELASRIQQIISGQELLFDLPQEMEEMAQNYAAQIIQTQTQNQNQHEDDQPNYREVDIDSLEMLRPRSVGCEHVALEAFNFLKLGEHLKTLGFNGPQLAAATGTIIGRMCHPASELATHYWLHDVSGLGELIDYDFNKINLYKMYSISDQLLKNKEAIEKYLYFQEKQLFGFQETITLYDLTNTYFEGQSEANKLGKHGRSKEKRSDCPLVTLALMLDSSGFPKSSEVFEGNISESQTLEKMIKGLEKKGRNPDIFEPQKATIVMDAGTASEDNIIWLKGNGYPYIVVSRKRHRQFNEDEAVVVKQDKNCTVKAQKVIDSENDEVLLYCHSTQREKKEQAINDRFTVRFEEALKYLEAGLHIKGRLKKYDKVIERIGRLKQKYSKASKLYKIDVSKDKKSGNAVKINWIRNAEPDTKDGFPGVYCLRTSHKDLDEDKLWRTYTMLTDLEAVFRSLKSELGMRPVFHQVTERVTGHLFISVLAYHLVHSIRYRLKKADIATSWSGLREQLAGQNRITISMHCKNDDMVHVRKSTRPEPRQQKIYSALGICSHPGETVKKIINKSSAITNNSKM
jgi:transposase